jgi:hypothetical protein
MGVIWYYDAIIPNRPDGEQVQLEVGSRNGTVILGMQRTDGKATCCAEMTVAETKELIEGILDAWTGRCGLKYEQRRRFCKSLGLHPSKRID